MRLLGVLGGMSWTSTAAYYRLLNEGVSRQLGGLHSARLLLHSVDFAPVAQMQHEGDWDGAARVLVEAARGLDRAGAEGLLLATNTMHKVADRLESEVGIPLWHIGDATARRLRAAGHRRSACWPRPSPWSRTSTPGACSRTASRSSCPTGAPTSTGSSTTSCAGVVREESRSRYREVMAGPAARGAEAVVLGCTEITLLVGGDDATVPLFDTTAIHVEDAVDWMLAGD